MTLIISLLLIAGGILISMLETAVISLGDAGKIEPGLLTKIEFFRRKTENFTLTSSVFKFFILWFCLYSAWGMVEG